MRQRVSGVLIALLGVACGPALWAMGNQVPAGPGAPAPGAPASPAQAPAPAPTPTPSAPPAPAAPAPPGQPAQQPAPTRLTPDTSTILERVLVRVNGEIFTQSELTQKQIEVLREKRLTGLTDDKLQAEVAAITPLILVEVVDDLLLVQRGREMGAKFTDERFNRALENIKKDNNLNDAQLKEALAQEGLTLEQLRQNLERAELRLAVTQREIGPSMTITQAEQRQYYASHRQQFMTPETVTLRQLLVAVPSKPGEPGQVADSMVEAAAKVKVGDLRTKAAAGADFAELVREHSDVDAATKANGGLVGPVKVEDLNPVLKDAILSLKPGEVSQPIRTPGGYQILRLETRTIAEPRSFESVRTEVEAAIRNERLEPETEKMLQRLRTGAVIEWKDETYRKMYETARSQRDAATPAPATPPVNQ